MHLAECPVIPQVIGVNPSLWEDNSCLLVAHYTPDMWAYHKIRARCNN